jgi:hypothetical protein
MRDAEELRVLRDRVADLERRVRRRLDEPAGCPATLGVVHDGGSMPTALPGQFLMLPARASFRPAEGQTPSITTTSRPFVATVVGSLAPSAGDALVCRGIGGRWAAERMTHSTGETITIPSCTGSSSTCFGVFPASMALTIPVRDFAFWYPDTLSAGSPPFLPATGGPFTLDDPGMYGTVQTDPGVSKSYYLFRCFSGFFALYQIIWQWNADSADYSTLSFDSIIYHWTPGFPGNSCEPFALHNGVSAIDHSTVYIN